MAASASQQMQDHLSAMRSKPMLPEIDALPCAEHQAPGFERDRKLHRGEGRPDMGWHVIVALVAMTEERVAVGNQTGQEALEITEHVRIRVLLHDETRGRMSNEERQEAAFHAALRHPLG